MGYTPLSHAPYMYLTENSPVANCLPETPAPKSIRCHERLGAPEIYLRSVGMTTWSELLSSPQTGVQTPNRWLPHDGRRCIISMLCVGSVAEVGKWMTEIID